MGTPKCYLNEDIPDGSEHCNADDIAGILDRNQLPVHTIAYKNACPVLDWHQHRRKIAPSCALEGCWDVLLQLFWFVPLNQTYLITYNSSDIPREFVDNQEAEMGPAGPTVAALSAGRRLFQGANLKSTLLF